MASPIEFSFSVVLLLFFAALLAGYIDTLVGGGGLITIPALMLAGLPPVYALGTNKLQAVAGSGTATLTLLAKGRIEFGQVRLLMLIAFVGSIVGAVLVQFIDAEILEYVVPSVIVLIALYFIFAPKASLSSSQAKVSNRVYASTAVPAIGFYDGMFGPGTGSFFVWAGVSMRGQGIVNSTMIAKTLNFATNIAALLVFIFYAKIVWKLGLIMMLGQSLGARLGARSLMTIDPNVLRLLVIAVCFVILIVWGVRTY